MAARAGMSASRPTAIWLRMPGGPFIRMAATRAGRPARVLTTSLLRLVHHFDGPNRQSKVALIRADAHRSIHMNHHLDFLLAWCCVDRSCNNNRLIAVANSQTRACLAVYGEAREQGLSRNLNEGCPGKING